MQHTVPLTSVEDGTNAVFLSASLCMSKTRVSSHFDLIMAKHWVFFTHASCMFKCQLSAYLCFFYCLKGFKSSIPLTLVFACSKAASRSSPNETATVRFDCLAFSSESGKPH
jgi:hypothetical protein